MDSDLQAAMAKRAALAEEIEKLDKLIELWTWWRDAAEPIAPQADSSTDSGKSPQAGLQSGTEGDREKHASPAVVVQESRAALLAAERPLKRGALLAALVKRGVKVGGSDKSKVLGTTLWRAKEFVSLPGWGYWLKDRPYAPALYDPHSIVSSLPGEEDFSDLL